MQHWKSTPKALSALPLKRFVKSIHFHPHQGHRLHLGHNLHSPLMSVLSVDTHSICSWLLSFGHSVMTDVLSPLGLQHARLPCPSLFPRVCSNSSSLSHDAIQPSHPLSPSLPPALNLSQHQGLFQWINSSHQIAIVLELQSFQWIFRVDFLGFPRGSAGEESTCSVGHLGLIPGFGKIPWRRERLPTPVFWPGEFQWLYSPWACKESDMAEQLSLSCCLEIIKSLFSMTDLWPYTHPLVDSLMPGG